MLLLVFAAAPVAAQTRPQPVPVALTQVSLISESPEESRFQLSFEPTANSFAPIASQPTQPSIGFALTSRGAHATQPRGMKGLVRAIAFEQQDTILILRFSVTRAASVSAVQSGNKSVEITVSTGKAATVAAEQTTEAVGSLPRAADYLPGEDGYELVLLKYADVSEVVGLLTDGLSVKSNDVFIPSEPGFGSNSLTGNSYNPQPAAQPPGGSDEPLGLSIDFIDRNRPSPQCHLAQRLTGPDRADEGDDLDDRHPGRQCDP